MFTAGLIIGALAYFLVRCVLSGIFTVEQNERAVLTSFGRAQRLGDLTTLDDPVSEHLDPEHRERYTYPQLRVIQPGGPYFKLPWQKVHKVSVSIQTLNIAFDPDDPAVNQNGTVLDAVTKDQLNIGITGQLRFKVSERNLHAYLFGVQRPISHVMGYFISILRERIATLSAPDSPVLPGATPGMAGVSINDLRKNLNSLNEQMDQQCLSSAARYGIVLDASLITGIDPPPEIESALAAINTAHNEVSADISTAQALADQRIEQSKRAVEIETMRAEAEMQPLLQLSEQLRNLKLGNPGALTAYLRNTRLDLISRAKRIFLEQKEGA